MANYQKISTILVFILVIGTISFLAGKYYDRNENNENIDVSKGIIEKDVASSTSITNDSTSSASVDQNSGPTSPITSVPYYFIAIHNEPAYDSPNQKEMLESGYQSLKRLAAKADTYNIKLTLMFTAQWADMIAADPAKMKDLEVWEKSGHEIAAHHHGINHGDWDGYTNYSQADIDKARSRMNGSVEPYLGNMEKYIASLKKINPGINAGCLNEEGDLTDVPKEIINLTCLGYANYGEPGNTVSDSTDAHKGENQFATMGLWNGINRYWLAHFQGVKNEQSLEEAEKTYKEMNGKEVYGIVGHSGPMEESRLMSLLEFLHSQDKNGEKSLTVTAIKEKKILPEEKVDLTQLKRSFSPAPSGNMNKLCGDGVCDSLEKANPNLCPGDCGFSDSKNSTPQPLIPPSGPSGNKLCGDGMCDAIEKANPNLCPQDCK